MTADDAHTHPDRPEDPAAAEAADARRAAAPDDAAPADRAPEPEPGPGPGPGPGPETGPGAQSGSGGSVGGPSPAERARAAIRRTSRRDTSGRPPGPAARARASAGARHRTGPAVPPEEAAGNPADRVRAQIRALRTGGPDPAATAPPATTAGPGEQTARPRPGDAARAALRAGVTRSADPDVRKAVADEPGADGPSADEPGAGEPAGRESAAREAAEPGAAEQESAARQSAGSTDVEGGLPRRPARAERPGTVREAPRADAPASSVPTASQGAADPLLSAAALARSRVAAPAESGGESASTRSRARRRAATPPPGGPRRTFPADTPVGDAGEGSVTVWSRAWEEAVTGLSADPGRLERGRRYERQGQVAAVTVTPGQALAYVHGSRARPYRARLRLRTFGEAEWAPLLDALAARPERLAALLEKELPAALLTAEGAALPPSAGEPAPECSCPDAARPCKHAAALAYRVGRLIAEDPFVLLLLRGRGEEDLVDALTRRHAHLAAEEEGRAERLPGMPAAEALSRPLRPLPPPLPRLDRIDPPPPYPAAEGGPDPLALDQVASDAAARALTFLRTGTDPVAGLSLWQDAVRLAASRPGSGLTSSGRTLYARLALAAGRTPTDLMRAVAAWRRGGPEALEALEGAPWNPPAGPFDRARPLLLAYGHVPYRPWHNRLTRPGGRHQLRMGRDGTWYGYESEPEAEDWWPRGTPDRDPAAVLDSLLGETATAEPGETDYADYVDDA